MFSVKSLKLQYHSHCMKCIICTLMELKIKKKGVAVNEENTHGHVYVNVDVLIKVKKKKKRKQNTPTSIEQLKVTEVKVKGAQNANTG